MSRIEEILRAIVMIVCRFLQLLPVVVVRYFIYTGAVVWFMFKAVPQQIDFISVVLTAITVICLWMTDYCLVQWLETFDY